MAQAETTSITRRAALKIFGIAGAAIAVPVALTAAKTPHERIAEHLSAINAAWAEIYGEKPRVSEFNEQSRFVLIAGRPDDKLT